MFTFSRFYFKTHTVLQRSRLYGTHGNDIHMISQQIQRVRPLLDISCVIRSGGMIILSLIEHGRL